MKKDGIQTRNRKISTKIKKSGVCRDARYDQTFRFLDNPTGFANLQSYSQSFNPMQFNPHGHMSHQLTGTQGFGHHVNHHSMFPPPGHHVNHPGMGPAHAHHTSNLALGIGAHSGMAIG